MNRLLIPFAVWLILFQVELLGIIPLQEIAAQEIHYEYKPAPIDNPLKGLVPYSHQTGSFPASMEFCYFPINAIMLGPDIFDWSPVETKLEQARSRGNQMVIRMYLEYPDKSSGMPNFLKELGVQVAQYKNNGRVNLTPDYHNPKLITAMLDFVSAFGKKYDGDHRIGFISMGILGHWGEWHTHPKPKLFASKENQTKIQNVFAEAFKTTKVLMRYPAGENDPAYAPNDESPFGYHDDSFAWATLDTGRLKSAWFFETTLERAGTKALNKWKTQPIGGEIRPEMWGCVFNDNSCAPQGQAFDKCVQQMHVTWLMDSGMFSKTKPPTKQQIKNASAQVSKMGYEFFIKSATIRHGKQQSELTVEVVNQGAAPFYYRWLVEVVILNPDQTILKTIKTDWDLTKSLPGDSMSWKLKFQDSANARFALRIPNPMKNGKPIRFANQTQQEKGLMVLND